MLGLKKQPTSRSDGKRFILYLYQPAQNEKYRRE